MFNNSTVSVPINQRINVISKNKFLHTYILTSIVRVYIAQKRIILRFFEVWFMMSIWPASLQLYSFSIFNHQNKMIFTLVIEETLQTQTSIFSFYSHNILVPMRSKETSVRAMSANTFSYLLAAFPYH